MANQLLSSEIITRMINEEMRGKEKLLSLAGDMGNLPNGIHESDTYSIIKVNHLTEMTDLAKGDSIPLEEITMSKSSEKVRHVAKGFCIFDEEKFTNIGGRSILDLKISDMASLRVRAMEKDLGAKMLQAPLTYVSNAMNESTITSALEKAFGDDQNYDDFSAIVINSALAGDFLQMDGFIQSNITYTAEGNGIVRNGQLGLYRGIPVLMSDICTVDNDQNMYATFVVKKNSLGYLKVAGEVEVSRNASKKCDEVYDSLLFVTGVVNDLGVLVIRTAK